MSGTLENRTRTAKTFNLTLAVAPLRREYARRTEGPDGQVRAAAKRLVHPDSITLLAGEKRSGLPDQIVACPEVKAALARHELRWTPDPVKAEPAKEPEHVAAEEASSVEPKPRTRSTSR
jgi:hypothetical protein